MTKSLSTSDKSMHVLTHCCLLYGDGVMRADMLVLPCLTRHVSGTSFGDLHRADRYIRLCVRSTRDTANANLPLSFFQLMQLTIKAAHPSEGQAKPHIVQSHEVCPRSKFSF